MTLRERIQKLCKISKTSLNQVENELGFGKGYLSKLDNSTPNTKKMEQVANHFGVTIDFLMGKTDMVVCPICGFGDNPLSEQSRKEHEAFHAKILKIKEKYPFFTHYSDASKTRSESISNFRNPQNTLEEKMVAFDEYLKSSFSLEISNCNYEIEHLNYEEFCKVEVGTLESDWAIPQELIDVLIEKYGVDRNFLNGNEQLLARASNSQQIMRILKYVEKLSPSALNNIEIQVKALAEQNPEE